MDIRYTELEKLIPTGTHPDFSELAEGTASLEIVSCKFASSWTSSSWHDGMVHGTWDTRVFKTWS